MYNFLVENSIYVVLIIVLIIWTGISSYLFNIDRRLEKIENQIITQDQTTN